jgi:hypothetical protein
LLFINITGAEFIMLKSDLTVCFIGGDKRQKYAAEKLSEYYKIKASGECFSGTPKINYSDSSAKAMHGARIIVLPLPAVKCESVLGFSEIVEYAQKNQAVILGGMFSQYMLDTMESLGVRCFDYYLDDCFTIKNAYIQRRELSLWLCVSLKLILGIRALLFWDTDV